MSTVKRDCLIFFNSLSFCHCHSATQLFRQFDWIKNYFELITKFFIQLMTNARKKCYGRTYLSVRGLWMHSLVCMVTPPPQLLEHAVHGLHSPQIPLVLDTADISFDFSLLFVNVFAYRCLWKKIQIAC